MDTKPLVRPVVVVVDDDKVVHAVIARALADFDGTVIHATDGFSGLRIATETRADLVITDALLPRLDGRELARLLKGADETRHCKVVVMTAIYKEARYRMEAFRDFMVDEYLHKPVMASTIRSLANEAARAARKEAS